MVFTGTFRRALDDKLRLAVPRPHRNRLELEAPLYLTPGLDSCLAVFPEPAFAALAERLGVHSPAAREVRDYSRLFYSQASAATLDRQWRFRVPPELARWADLSGEVMIVGVRDHLEVWAPERWEQYVSRCDPHYDQLAEHALAGTAVAPSPPPATSTPPPRTAPR